MSAAALYLLLVRATALSFSGFASVPIVQEDLVAQRAVLTDEQVNSAIAISQASPGPLALYAVVVGYFVAGVSGALAGALALATPALPAIPIVRAVRCHRDARVRGACAAIVIGFTGCE
jgi:chromate transporter